MVLQQLVAWQPRIQSLGFKMCDFTFSLNSDRQSKFFSVKHLLWWLCVFQTLNFCSEIYLYFCCICFNIKFLYFELKTHELTEYMCHLEIRNEQMSDIFSFIGAPQSHVVLSTKSSLSNTLIEFQLSAFHQVVFLSRQIPDYHAKKHNDIKSDYQMLLLKQFYSNIAVLQFAITTLAIYDYYAYYYTNLL